MADLFSENVVSVQGLPFSVALNFTIQGKDKLVPMTVEEPSVVAAASNAAKMIRSCGGFCGEAAPSLMTGQIQLDDVQDLELACTRIIENRDRILTIGNESIPKMVKRGGGCRDLEVRILDEDSGLLVVHIYVDVGNAMGANMVDTVAEAVAPSIHELAGGELGLRILSNLAIRRKVKVTARVDAEAVGGGPELLASIARASRFAELDPYRAVTHNKGIMNGIDAAAVALGQDWRAIEAGAHGYAALSGQIKPLAVWNLKDDGFLHGEIELPLAVATVGGVSKLHPGVRAAFELLDVESAQELAVVLASCGLASNLAALRALAGEGIQKGHMRLHDRRYTNANSE
jgi:hydroxymethylglutaryl-CoA reductase